jgi:GTP-binding protein HflX
MERIRDLKAELKTVIARKDRMVKARASETFTVALVGYTNAGKSTLMRALTGRDALVEDRLFSTVDTQTAALPLGGGISVPLSDSVGFIRRLPHNLVAGFHATLAEAGAADLLLHVVDASSPFARGQIDVVREVLAKIGCGEHEVLLVFNKCDALPPTVELEHLGLCRDFPEALCVSALRKEGLAELRLEIRRRAEAHAVPVTAAVHVGDGRTHAYLASRFFTHAQRRDGEWITYVGRAHPAVLDHLAGAGKTVRICEPTTKGAEEFPPLNPTAPSTRDV